HLSVAKDLVDHLDLHELKILPSGQPPHKPCNLASNKHRLKMIELGIKNHLNSISLEEFELNNNATSYTINTLKHFRQKLGASKTLIFCLGEDSFQLIDTWLDWERLTEYCHLVVISRKGFNIDLNCNIKIWSQQHQCSEIKNLHNKPFGNIYFCKLAQIDISSSEIRNNIAKKISIKGLVPTEVQEYIVKNSLYKDAT
ncbi:MAG: nicotinate (nicotinamide) nucleotide adenylyltransferase, partial [Pseudomonadota bacterium]|nr:nicotinate (nicotinamide) nucleotide adenylyltransferase [Pseudomonadota bacterium]